MEPFKEIYKDEFDLFKKYYDRDMRTGAHLIKHIIKQVNALQYRPSCELVDDVDGQMYEYTCDMDIPQLSSINSKISYATKQVRLGMTNDKGRGLFAAEDINSDTLIIIEPATILQMNPTCICFASKRTTIYRCHHCAKPIATFYTCRNCNMVAYCSMDCLDEDNETYHKYECYGWKHHFWPNKDTDYSYLAMKIMLYGAAHNFDRTYDYTYHGNPTNNYPYIYLLETTFKSMNINEINMILHQVMRNLVYLIEKTSFFTDLMNNHSLEQKTLYEWYIYVGGLMVKHYCHAQINNVFLKIPNYVRDIGIKYLSGSGKGICPTIAMLNHSCLSNAAIIVRDNVFMVKTKSKIQKDEEITISYFEINIMFTVEEKRDISNGLFNFDCYCVLCVNERVRKNQYKCQLCKTGFVKRIDIGGEKAYSCLRCKIKDKDLDKWNRMFKRIEVAENMYYQRKDLKTGLILLEEYNKIYSNYKHQIINLQLELSKLFIKENDIWNALKFALDGLQYLEYYCNVRYLPLISEKLEYFKYVMNTIEQEVVVVNLTHENILELKRLDFELKKLKDEIEFYMPIVQCNPLTNCLLAMQTIFEEIQNEKQESKLI